MTTVKNDASCSLRPDTAYVTILSWQSVERSAQVRLRSGSACSHSANAQGCRSGDWPGRSRLSAAYASELEHGYHRRKRQRTVTSYTGWLALNHRLGRQGRRWRADAAWSRQLRGPHSTIYR
jgi:hypothetical protein